MLLILYWSLLLCSLWLLVVLHFITNGTKHPKQHQEVPLVSILVAARNEEDNLEMCLQALLQLDYPFDRLEIWIGNDASTDCTELILQRYAHLFSHIQYINITDTVGLAKGKANVLAQLARKAKGDYFFITDADIQVPTTWIQSLLEAFTPQTGIVSGCTSSQPIHWLGKAQQLDWLYAFGMVRIVSDWNLPVSAVGNNMAIRRKAYEDTGGYEAIPFSVTEDQALFLETIKHGWKFKNLMNSSCLALTQPIHNWSALLKQRRRWMQGAMKLPLVLLFVLFLQGLVLPALFLGFWFMPVFTLFAWILKIGFQQMFMRMCFKRVGLRYHLWLHTVLFEWYSLVLSPLVILQYLFIRKVEWKGRVYYEEEKRQTGIRGGIRAL
ncbi:MAG: glycosyltransferase [Cytophagaceae bacterium]|nr:glycosyltransferase [Cytophagaceae bacterium]